MNRDCKCDNCDYCGNMMHEKRRSFYCKHPDQKYIMDYCNKKRFNYAPGFIGYSENYGTVPIRKKTPAWCPLKISNGENNG